DGVSATLTGDVTVDFNCPDCICANHTVPFTLTFMPGPMSGCVTKAGGVTGCSGAGNQAVISLGANSIVVAPHDTAFIAELKFMAPVPQNVPPNLPNVIQASTEACAISACQSGGFPCVECAAEGCTAAVATFHMDMCPHPCPSVITYYANKPDT